MNHKASANKKIKGRLLKQNVYIYSHLLVQKGRSRLGAPVNGKQSLGSKYPGILRKAIRRSV